MSHPTSCETRRDHTTSSRTRSDRFASIGRFLSHPLGFALLPVVAALAACTSDSRSSTEVVTCADIEMYLIVTVEEPVTAQVGETVELGAECDGTDVTESTTWTSLSPENVSVSNETGSEGEATAEAVWGATVRAEFENENGEVGVDEVEMGVFPVGESELRFASPPAEGEIGEEDLIEMLSISTDDPDVDLPLVQSIAATLRTSDGTIRRVTEDAEWAVDNEDVLTVSNDEGSKGELTISSQGSANVTADYFGESASLPVEITGGGGSAGFPEAMMFAVDDETEAFTLELPEPGGSLQKTGSTPIDFSTVDTEMDLYYIARSESRRARLTFPDGTDSELLGFDIDLGELTTIETSPSAQTGSFAGLVDVMPLTSDGSADPGLVPCLDAGAEASIAVNGDPMSWFAEGEGGVLTEADVSSAIEPVSGVTHTRDGDGILISGVFTGQGGAVRARECFEGTLVESGTSIELGNSPSGPGQIVTSPGSDHFVVHDPPAGELFVGSYDLSAGQMTEVERLTQSETVFKMEFTDDGLCFYIAQTGEVQAYEFDPASGQMTQAAGFPVAEAGLFDITTAGDYVGTTAGGTATLYRRGTGCQLELVDDYSPEGTHFFDAVDMLVR